MRTPLRTFVIICDTLENTCEKPNEKHVEMPNKMHVSHVLHRILPLFRHSLEIFIYCLCNEKPHEKQCENHHEKSWDSIHKNNHKKHHEKHYEKHHEKHHEKINIWMYLSTAT